MKSNNHDKFCLLSVVIVKNNYQESNCSTLNYRLIKHSALHKNPLIDEKLARRTHHRKTNFEKISVRFLSQNQCFYAKFSSQKQCFYASFILYFTLYLSFILYCLNLLFLALTYTCSTTCSWPYLLLVLPPVRRYGQEQVVEQV